MLSAMLVDTGSVIVIMREDCDGKVFKVTGI